MANWKSNVREVVPYTPGEQPKTKVIKLNTNENPYPPSPLVGKAISNIELDSLRKYPDPGCQSLISALAKYHGVDEENVFVGVGSDDVLAMSFLTFFNSDKPIFFPDITYSFYDVWASLFRIPFETKALDEDFKIIKSDYDTPCGGIVIPNPNAPTGIAEPVSFFEDIVKAHPECVVIIDEAYVDFGSKSAIDLVRKYDNVLVVRTFSKSRAMAGNRIGYAIGSKELIKYLSDCKFSFNSYTMDTITLQAGVASIEDDSYFKEKLDAVISTREWTKVQLKKLGFTFPDSKSNFIFAKHESMEASFIFEELKKRGIYVRYFSKPQRISNYLRISIGTDEEMQVFIDELEKILKGV
ncbi:histidinol-phosphate transaminase [Pseudobutyrivibrio ruminis]|uniref:Histidinol-phosphate aminotransferase n=1 Tax=Pseudobutyrivibrio ruminis DSM 9787 TaxID=1123011 RepID=A0A285SGY9_9FIRM|nr:histidinol-phosphate transaminase [Pseudobutyrivibrio ruminis]SOC06650.1 histidinol-phosphate aminotransferase [Pseudobutyrivibrio ruminis DSM 9787]